VPLTLSDAMLDAIMRAVVANPDKFPPELSRLLVNNEFILIDGNGGFGWPATRGVLKNQIAKHAEALPALMEEEK
jgi:hypothetical protein